MGKKSLKHTLKGDLQKKLRSVALVPFVLGSMLLPTHTPALAMQDYIRMNQEQQNYNRSLLMPRQYQMYNSTQQTNYEYSRQARITSVNNDGPSVPGRDDRAVLVISNRSAIAQDDNGKQITQQSYGGFSGLLPEFHTGSLGNFGYWHWLPKNHYYYVNSSNGSINANVWGAIFHQHFGSVGTNFDNIYFQISTNFRARVELYTGTLVFSNTNIAWNEGFKIAVRGVADPSGQTRKGIKLTSTNSTIYGAIQGTPQADTITFEGGQVLNKKFAGFDYIALGRGNDELSISGTAATTIRGHIFMEEGNDTISFQNYNSHSTGVISMGAGDDLLVLAGNGNSSISGGIYMGSGNDTLQYNAQNIRTDDIYMGTGNDSIEIKTTTGSQKFDSGAGNDTIRIVNSSNINNATFVMGDGHDLFDLGASSYDKKIHFGTAGHNTIRVSTGSYTYNSTYDIGTAGGLYFEASSSGGNISIGGVNNNGLFGLSIGNGASYSGPTGSGNGRVDIHFYNNSKLNSDLSSGSGDDKFTLDKISTNFGINAGSGTNTISINETSMKSITASGNDSLSLKNSTVTNGVTLTGGGSTKNILIDNATIQGSGFEAAAGHSSTITLQGTLSMGNQSTFTSSGGRQEITINNLNMSGTKTTLNFTPTQQSTVNFRGSLTVGDINITTAKSNVHFNAVNITQFGTLSTSALADTITLEDNTKFSGKLNLGSSGGASDHIILRNSSIEKQGQIEYAENLSLFGYGNSKVDGTVKASGKLDIELQDTANISGDIVHQTSKEINLTLANQSSIQGKISVDTNIPLNLHVIGRDSAHLSTDVVAGQANDTIEVTLYNAMNYTGKIDAGDGNNRILLANLSTNGNIGEIKAGAGNDSVELRGGLFQGATKFQLGTGNNSVVITGDVSMPGDLIVYETANTSTKIAVQNNINLYAKISTGSVEGSVSVGNNSTVHGGIQGLGAFSVTLNNASVVKGDITAGDGDARLTLNSSLVEGNIESNRGKQVVGDIRNSTVQGGLNAVTNGTNVSLTLNNTSVGKKVMLSNATLTGSGNTLGESLVIQGTSNVQLSRSTIASDVTMSLGNSSVSFNSNTVRGGLTVVDGQYDVTLNNSSITGSVNVRQGSMDFQSTGSTIDGDIVLSPFRTDMPEVQTRDNLHHNSLTIKNGRVGGGITFTQSNISNAITLTDSTVGKDISIGIKENTVELTNSTVAGDMIFQGTTTTVLRNSKVQGTLNFTSAALHDQNLTIIGNTWSPLTLGKVNNTVTIQDATLESSSGTSFTGNDMTDHVTLVNTQVLGSINLGAGSDLLQLINTTVLGSIELQKLQGEQNTLILNQANIQGNIQADYIEILGDSRVAAITTKAGTKTTTNNSEVNLGLTDNTNATYLKGGSTLFVTPSKVGDTLNVYGKLNVENGSLGIDVDFINGLHDTVIVKNGASVLGDSGFLVVTPVNVFTGAEELAEEIKGVLKAEATQSFEYLPRLKDVFVQAGGNLYQLMSDTSEQNTFNLVQSGEDPLNYGYGTMILSGRNYSRNILDSLEEHGIITQISGSEERTAYGRKNKKDIVTLWMQASGSSNQISAPFIPSVKSKLATALVGLDIKEIDIAKKDRLLFRLFGGYGTSVSNYSYDAWDIEGRMQAYSLGGQFIWENLRNNAYRFYIRSTTWGDIFNNTLHNIISFHPEQWSSTSLSTALAMGIKMKFNRFIIIPEVEMVYSYHSASEMISMTKNLVEIKEAHQLTAKIQGTAAYNFPFGLSPYVRVALEVPVGIMPKGSDGVYIAGKYHKYEVSDILTRLGAGLNYAVSLGGFDITAYLDASAHFGREQGIKASLGFAIGF